MEHWGEMMKKRVTLISGGGRSGKSRHALAKAEGYGRRGFVATAIPFDDEMTARIAKHREDRDAAYITVEAPVDMVSGIRALEGDADVAVVDCLTVWLGNLMHRHGESETTFPEVEALLTLLKDPPLDLILVTNEVGSGIIPLNRTARVFRDVAGFLNQSVAALADEVILVACGLPITLKSPSR
jgi:adenosylcobinamide kinase/adenosylcobinamide-phosphate guanylyltransferase